MCHQSRAPVPTSEVILVRLRVAPTRPPRASSTARDATIFPPPHPPRHARLARSRASTTVPSRAADHPARSSTLARARVIIHRRRPRPRDDDDERDATRRANTRAHAPSPFPSLARIASHRIERDAPTTPRARVMRRPPRARRLGSPVARRGGRVAEAWGSRGGTDDESRSVTNDRARASDAPRARRLGSPVARRGGRVAEAWGSRGGTDDESRSVTNDRARARGGIRSVDRAIGRVDRPTGDDKNGPLSHTYGPSTTVSGRRTIVTYINSACRCVCMGWVVVTRRSVGRSTGRSTGARARAIRSIRSAVGRRSTGRWRRRRRARRRRRRRARRRRDAGWGGGVAGARGRWRGRGWGRAR